MKSRPSSAVAFDAAAAESDHDPLVGGNEFRQAGDLPLAENQLGRIVIDEIVHGEYLFYSIQR